MSRIKTRLLLLTAAVLPLAPGCTVREKVKAVWSNVPFVSRQGVPIGAAYPPTVKVKPFFQADQAQMECNVFAHLLVWTPAGSTGLDIAQAVEAEAMRRGADMLLIGRSRQAKEDNGLDFVYYGPEEPYSCRARWIDWKFGSTDWINQGEWASIGYEEWGQTGVQFDIPLVIQAAFLRCQAALLR